MNKRPVLLDFRSISEGIIDRVCLEAQLPPEGKGELCAIVLQLSVEADDFGERVEQTLLNYDGSEACKVAFCKFCEYLVEALSNPNESP